MTSHLPTRQKLPDNGFTIEDLGRAGLIATGIAYVLGVLITSVHLGELGFAPPELIQARYLSVGALWLTLVGGTLATMTWSWSVLSRRWQLGGLRNRTYGIALSLFLISAIVTLLQLASNGNLQMASAKFWLVIAVMLAAAGQVWVDLKHLAEFRTRIGQRDAMPPFSIRYYLYQIVWGLVTSYVFTCAYARFAYPEFPSAIGGGRPSKVMLLPDASKVDIMRRLHVPEKADGLFGPVDLEAEDSSTYFLVCRIAARRTPIRLNKDTCEGVLAEAR